MGVRDINRYFMMLKYLCTPISTLNIALVKFAIHREPLSYRNASRTSNCYTTDKYFDYRCWLLLRNINDVNISGLKFFVENLRSLKFNGSQIFGKNLWGLKFCWRKFKGSQIFAGRAFLVKSSAPKGYDALLYSWK